MGAVLGLCSMASWVSASEPCESVLNGVFLSNAAMTAQQTPRTSILRRQWHLRLLWFQRQDSSLNKSYALHVLSATSHPPRKPFGCASALCSAMNTALGRKRPHSGLISCGRNNFDTRTRTCRLCLQNMSVNSSNVMSPFT